MTIQRTRTEMKERGEIVVKREGEKGRAGAGTWYIYLGEVWTKLPKWEQTPFDFSDNENT